MNISLRPYQTALQAGVFEAWQNGHRNVLAQAPTGAGKTVIMSSTVKAVPDPTVSIAHRQELVSQISLSLARSGIYHRIIGATSVKMFCIARHIEETGKNFSDDLALDAVAGVQTLIRRPSDQWFHSVKMWNIDEAHHVTPTNSWGKASLMFPNAFGLGFTASPTRADRKPLGRALGGMFDHMVLGPTPRELINQGYLSDYRLFAPTTSIDRSQIPVSEATGDLNQDALRKAAHKSQIVGDLVENYLKFAPGKRGIAFVVDVEQATETAERFIAAGVKAMAVSAKTPDRIRNDAVKRFTRGDLDVLVNVDLFGEGFDVPAVEVVMMGRPTESFGLYLQQFGRALRVFEGKEYGIVIDHVGNWKRHGLPDAHRVWSLEQDLRGTPRGEPDPDVIPLRRCTACFQAYEAINKACVFCGHEEEPESRGGPQFVDGDLIEIDSETLAKMRGDVNAIQSWDTATSEHDDPVSRAKKLNIRKRQTAQTELADTIDLWAGIQTTIHDRNVSQAYRLFYLKYGVDTVSAKGMETAKMMALTEELRKEFV